MAVLTTRVDPSGDEARENAALNTVEDRERLLKYRDMAKREQQVLFGGRLGSYKYLDMHMAMGSALSMFDNRIRPHFEDHAPLASGDEEQ